MLVGETHVESIADGFLVHLLSYEHKLLHTVAILLVPVATQSFFTLKQWKQFVLGHCCIPLSGILQTYLSACLLKDVAHVGLILKPAQSLAAYHALGPKLANEVVEEVHVHRTACVIYECADAVFLNLTALMVVMMAVAVLVVMVVMMMFMFMFMFMVLMFIFVIIIIVYMFVAMMMFYFVNPGSRCSHFVEVEAMCVEQQVKVYIAVVARNNLCLWLQCAYYVYKVSVFFGRNLRCLVEQYSVAELNLLYYEIFKIVFVKVLLLQVVAATELILHAQSVHYGDNAVQSWHTILYVFRT